MIELAIVEFGDPRTGAGFVHYQDPNRSPAAPVFVKAAQALTTDGAGQPPDGTQDNDRYPVWTLRMVEIPTGGPYWCFSVQGRNGAFGRAGSCQFAFAAGDVAPSKVWRTAVRMIQDDGRLGYDVGSDVRVGHGDPDRLAEVIGDLAAGAERIVVDGDPVRVAAAIGDLVAVLPTAVVRSYVWGTYLLQQPVLGQPKLVVGRWPAELAQLPPAVRVDRWLSDAAPRSGTFHPGPRTAEAIDWLATIAAQGKYVVAYQGFADLPSLLDQVAHDQLSIRPGDVPELVRRNDERLYDERFRGFVEDHARANPDWTINRLVAGGHPEWLVGLLFDGLLAADTAAPAGANPMRFPPDREWPDTGWHAALARMLAVRYPTTSARAEFVRARLRGPGRPLADADAVTAAQDWLELLELRPDDPVAMDIFPISVDRIVTELTHTGQLGATHRTRLVTGDLVGTIRQVVARFDVVPAVAAAALLSLDCTDEQRVAVLGEVLAHNERRQPGDQWLGELLSQRLDEHVRQVVLSDGMRYLVHNGHRITAPLLLRIALEWYAGQLDDDVWRPVITAAADQLRSPQPQRETRPETAGWGQDPSYLTESAPVHMGQTFDRPDPRDDAIGVASDAAVPVRASRRRAFDRSADVRNTVTLWVTAVIAAGALAFAVIALLHRY